MHSSHLLRETTEGCRNGIEFYLLERDMVFWRRLVQQIIRAKDAEVERLVVYLAAAQSGRVLRALEEHPHLEAASTLSKVQTKNRRHQRRLQSP